MDEKIFLLIYNLPHGSVLNFLFSIISALGSYGAIWVLIAIIFLKKRKELLRFFLGFFCLTIVIFWLQNFMARARPYDDILGVGYLGFIDAGSYSFPSHHAAASFLGAFFLGEKIKKFKIYFFALAILISFSRIYLGAHYLTDILAGGIMGVVFGKAVINYGRCTNRDSVALF